MGDGVIRVRGECEEDVRECGEGVIRVRGGCEEDVRKCGEGVRACARRV